MSPPVVGWLNHVIHGFTPLGFEVSCEDRIYPGAVFKRISRIDGLRLLKTNRTTSYAMHIMVCMDVWSKLTLLQAVAIQHKALQGRRSSRQQRAPAAEPAAAANLGYGRAAANFRKPCMRDANR